MKKGQLSARIFPVPSIRSQRLYNWSCIAEGSLQRANLIGGSNVLFPQSLGPIIARATFLKTIFANPPSHFPDDSKIR